MRDDRTVLRFVAVVVTRAHLRGVAGLLLGAVLAAVEAVWVVLAVPMAVMGLTRRLSISGTRRLAQWERARVGRCLGCAVGPAPVSSRTVAYLAARAVVSGLGCCVFVLVVVWAALSSRALSGGAGSSAEMSWYDPITWTVFVILIVFLTAQLLLGLTALERRLAMWGLAPSDKDVLRHRVDQLSRTRVQVLEAVYDERRRIERDLHDGVQQRLVALGMLLGRAHRARDPGVATELFVQAHEETRHALTELREVAWRIYPVILDDSGLDAALESLVERSATPIVLDYGLDRRPSPVQETVAYFTVCEAVTNALKHSGSQQIEVAVHQVGATLTVRVTDSGVGGARADGRGLSGLARRVAAVDGHFEIHSPPGGPTMLSVEIPCG